MKPNSLYVIPEYRNRGIASSLIKAALKRYKDIGKPFGLLVEPHNTKAYKLYNELGFNEDGVNNFCGEPMIHLSCSGNKTVSKRNTKLKERLKEI